MLCFFSVEILGPFESAISEDGTLMRSKAKEATRRLYNGEASPLSSLDCHEKLVFAGAPSGRGELKGGPIDALIVEATKATKKDFTFQEAFVTTYRTFLSSEELIDKLLFRYGVFSPPNEVGLGVTLLRRVSVSLTCHCGTLCCYKLFPDFFLSSKGESVCEKHLHFAAPSG